MAMTQLLSLILSRIRQPRVIAEVIAGVILGPTVMGRIPGFTQAIFPQAGMAALRLTSTIGLVFFLFLVGLEIDTRVMKHNMVASASVSIAGLIFPLGLGAALGVGVYREFVNPSVNFGIFLLFTAVAVGITAFPVLCRILSSLDLLQTEVGLVTLAAGIGNDVIGWVLLALTVALVNASSGLTALWVLLASAGYTVFLLVLVRWGYRWLAERTGSIEQGTPSPLMMAITLFLVLISAFYTDIIGVHPIFGIFFSFLLYLIGLKFKIGGFLAGLVIPHDNGYSISVAEKLENLVTVILLPVVCACLQKKHHIKGSHHLTVFCSVRVEHKSRLAQYRHMLGVYRHYLSRRFYIEIHRLWRCCTLQWLQLARIGRHWFSDELQRVHDLRFFFRVCP